MPSYSKELKIAQKAAEEASLTIKKFASDLNFGIEFKGKNDLVTDADLETEKVILDIIGEAFPDDQVMAEETEQEKQIPDKRTWLVDPIDGTTNFAHGFPVYCTSIAMWEKGRPRVGVVLEINRDELFHAVLGEGAWLNNKPIKVSSVSDISNAMIGTGFPYNDLQLIRHYLNFLEWMMFNTQGIRRPGAAAYDLCCVAAGRFDGFYEYSLNAWDVGAASLLVTEAGGVVSDWEGGDNWLFGKRMAAGNPQIHAALLKAIRQHFTEDELEAAVFEKQSRL